MEIVHRVMNPIDQDSSEEDNSSRYLFKEGTIDRDTVKSAVYNRIDFPLSNKMWRAIDNSFEKCWNTEIGRGGDVYAEFMVNYIYNSLVNRQIIIEYSRMEKIVEIILDYIKMTGGFMDEPGNE